MNRRATSVLLVCCLVVAYFTYHLIVGDHGIRAHGRVQQQIAALQGELAGLKDVRKRLERDVALLRAEKLDPDMLDERARAILNFAHPNDIVIISPKTATGSLR